jgi:hypothetical protein
MSEVPIEQELEGLTEDELFLRLGYMHVGSTAVPESPKSLVERGRAFFDQAKVVLQPILCRPEAATARDGLTYVALAELIKNEVATTATFHLAHGAALVVAMLIIRQGLTRFCADYPPVPPQT